MEQRVLSRGFPAIFKVVVLKNILMAFLDIELASGHFDQTFYLSIPNVISVKKMYRRNLIIDSKLQNKTSRKVQKNLKWGSLRG